MAISGDYPTPVNVNGYSCKNCTDVDYAKKHIDPAHPRSGPYGINAKDDPTVTQSAAVIFAGGLSGFNKTATADIQPPAQGAPSTSAVSLAYGSRSGTQLDISA